MKVRCFCGQYMLDPEHALYVRDGIPLCSSATCQQVAKNGRDAFRILVTTGRDPGDESHFHRHLAPAEPVPFVDEHDRVAEVYGRCRDDGSLVFVANRRRA